MLAIGGSVSTAGQAWIADRAIAVFGWCMPCRLHVAWDDRLAGYDFGSGHPMAPARVEMTIELARTFGLFSAAGVSVEPPASADEWQLEMVHVQPYIAAVRQTGDPAPDPSLLDFGLGVVTRLCETLLRNGAPGLHVYTINQAGPTMRLWEALELAVTA